MSFDEIEQRLAAIETSAQGFDPAMMNAAELSRDLLRLGERVLEHWIEAHDKEPTDAEREGFRLLALHRQACKGDPSFNACRETCRELCYHHNLILSDPEHPELAKRLKLATLVAKHLLLFVSGKMQVANLGEFCCSSRPIRGADDEVASGAIAN